MLHTYSLTTALSSAFGSGKRVLFRCGDKFTGSYHIAATTNKATIGAYGGCQNTTANRPVLQNSSGITLAFNNQTPPAGVPTDIRVADLDFEDGTTTATAITNWVQSGHGSNARLTLYNLKCEALKYCYETDDATESGVIQST